jgi:hypothetical protein
MKNLEKKSSSRLASKSNIQLQVFAKDTTLMNNRPQCKTEFKDRKTPTGTESQFPVSDSPENDKLSSKGNQSFSSAIIVQEHLQEANEEVSNTNVSMVAPQSHLENLISPEYLIAGLSSYKCSQELIDINDFGHTMAANPPNREIYQGQDADHSTKVVEFMGENMTVGNSVENGYKAVNKNQDDSVEKLTEINGESKRDSSDKKENCFS